MAMATPFVTFFLSSSVYESKTDRHWNLFNIQVWVYCRRFRFHFPETPAFRRAQRVDHVKLGTCRLLTGTGEGWSVRLYLEVLSAVPSNLSNLNFLMKRCQYSNCTKRICLPPLIENLKTILGYLDQLICLLGHLFTCGRLINSFPFVFKDSKRTFIWNSFRTYPLRDSMWSLWKITQAESLD